MSYDPKQEYYKYAIDKHGWKINYTFKYDKIISKPISILDDYFLKSLHLSKN